MKNPYSVWRQPRRYFAWRSRAQAYEDYKGGRIELNDWERDLFLPELVGRIQYVETILGKLLVIAEDEETGKYIGAALLKVIRAPGVGAATPDTFGANFLKQVADQIRESFLGPLANLRARYANVPDLATFRRFANDVALEFSPLSSLDAELFHSRYFHFVQIKLPDGKLVYEDRPFELQITLTPFRSWLDELGRVARTTIESIQRWSKQTHEEGKTYFEYLARKQERAGLRLQVLSQTLLIILSIAVSAFFLTANDPYNLVKKNVELQRQVAAREADVRAASERVAEITRGNERLNAELEQVRRSAEHRESK